MKCHSLHTAVALAAGAIVCADAISPLRRRARGWLSTNPALLKRSLPSFPRGGHHEGGRVVHRAGEEQTVIIIDVDNTLYSEQDLVSTTGDGIESQIVRNTHLFGLLHFNLTTEECDELYRTHGSTIEGLRQLVPQDQVEEMMARFYREVYDPIDFSSLLGASTIEEGDQQRSGYDHGNALHKQRKALAEFMKSISLTHPVYLASNSPRAHILRVMKYMGLGDARDFAGMLSPDMDYCDAAPKMTSSDNPELAYPTKACPEQYYSHVFKRYPRESNRFVLLDDSLYNIQQAQSVGINGIHISQAGRTLEEGLSEAVGHILPAGPTSNGFTFSDVEYLNAKNVVDMNAINPFVWEELAQELALRMQQGNDDVLRIADLGAGMLSMLELLLNGGGEAESQKESFLTLMNKVFESGGTSGDEQLRTVSKLEYFAYESNMNLLEGCRERLHRLGFREVDEGQKDAGFLFRRSMSENLANGREIVVHLRPVDFRGERDPPKDLDLVIGCCFADLFDPDQLAHSLQRFALGDRPPLVYFPITFSGTTQFSRSYPPAMSGGQQLIPSDTTAFRMYSDSLVNHGHNLDPTRIVDAISDRGGNLISMGSSNWVIDPSSNQRLWETMLYFFGMTGARELKKHGLDAAGWMRRCRDEPRTILVSNVDLLIRLQSDSTAHEVNSDGNDDLGTVSVQEIQFVGPCNVTTVTKRWNAKDSSHLSPREVEIESVSSLISTGTELKIFKGSFESAPLDVNIDGMADQTMQYPLAYGYSLVGRVVACGSEVDDADSLVGRLVFAFSAHSSRVICDRDAIHLVPDGISAEDAIFFPSMETALSLVHDACIRIGENVAVYGQGLIGLLVTAVLSMSGRPLLSAPNCFNTVTVFDMIEDRLAVASSLGATSALKPDKTSTAGPFDVAIEVSGNAAALQSAIDNTSDNGRIIIGSWYGASSVDLRLGIDFHRSGKTIKTSQVSTVRPSLAGLWDKDRRFSLTWALVKALRPSRLLTKRMTLDDAQRAYELLDRGQEIAICFKYNEKQVEAQS